MSNHRTIGGVLQVQAKEAVVCSDFHVPGESKVWVQKLKRYLIDNKIKTLVVGGDFWNFDAISRWVIKDKKLTLPVELTRGLTLLYSLAQLANVYLVCGNHDKRIAIAFGGAISFSEWMESLSIQGVWVTDNDYLILQSGSKKFRVCHPDVYSKIKGSISSKLAHNLQENVIVGHSHNTSFSTDFTGNYLCIDSGSMCSSEMFDYKNAATVNMPNWENSFVHIKEGKVRLITKNTF